jgi:hypothetical protein
MHLHTENMHTRFLRVITCYWPKVTCSEYSQATTRVATLPPLTGPTIPFTWQIIIPILRLIQKYEKQILNSLTHNILG